MTQPILDLIAAVKANERSSQAWDDLAEALAARGQDSAAEFCLWRAGACGQDPDAEAKAILRSALQQVIQSKGMEGLKPGTPVADTGAVIAGLVDRLCAATDDDEIRVTSELLTLFAGVKAVRINAVAGLAKYSWRRVLPYLVDARGELETVPEAMRIAGVWAALFRECPNEMSHAYLSAGWTVHPTAQEESMWRGFIQLVQKILGTSIGKIVDEQIPDLP